MPVSRVYAIAVSSVVMLSLLTPLVIFLIQPAREVSKIEKRKLTIFPEVIWNYDSFRHFPEKFTDYFQDHFGLRDFMVNLHNSSMLKLFETSPSPSVIKGLDDWYFYVAGDVANDYYGLKNVNAQQLENFSQALIDHRDWLESLGIRYLFVPVPNKINVYSDKLPGRLQKLGQRTFYEQITAYRQNEIDENTVNVYTLLKESKKEHEVYFRTDTHWNDDGALDTFNLIIQQLNKWFPELQKVHANDIEREHKDFSGDLTNMLHQTDDISEKSDYILFKSHCSNEKNDKQLPVSLSIKIKNRDPENRALPVENGCKKEKLTVLVIHDSFGLYLRSYFNERFNRVIYSSKYEFSELHDFIIFLKPDIVIEERVARDIIKTLAKDIELEAKVVEYQMSKAGKIVLDISSDRKADYIQSKYNAVISKEGNGYLVNATTADPQLFFQFKPLSRDKRYNTMIELTVPDDTQIQFFYTPVGASSYSSEYSVRRKVKKGYNKLFFHIPGPLIEGDIRLDPGGVAGPYILHAFAIKER